MSGVPQWVDTHCHLQMLDDSDAEMVAEAEAGGVGIAAVEPVEYVGVAGGQDLHVDLGITASKRGNRGREHGAAGAPACHQTGGHAA